MSLLLTACCLLALTPADHGGQPNDDRDDTAAIQAAIDAAAKAGGGTVDFPRGVYLVRPSRTAWINLASGVTLRGEPGAILRVMPNAGNYGRILSQPDLSGFLSNVAILGLAFDEAPDANPGASLDPKDNATIQNVVRVSAHGFTVRDCRFDKLAGTVALNVTGSDVRVEGCSFRFKPTAAKASNYDNSAVYIEATGFHVAGNDFSAAIGVQGNPPQSAASAIEIHGCKGVVVGNRTDGYANGCNVVSAYFGMPGAKRMASDLVVASNTFTNCNIGVHVGAWTGTTLRNLAITGNTISIAQVSHNLNLAAGVSMILERTAGGVDGLVVSGNTIAFQPGDIRAKHRDGGALSVGNTAGIALQPPTGLRNFVVTGNLVANSPGAGIAVGYGWEASSACGGLVANNVLIDCGGNSSFPAACRAAFYVTGAVCDLRIEGNVLRDTGAEKPTGAFGLVYQPSSAANVTYARNQPATASGSSLPDAIDRGKPLVQE